MMLKSLRAILSRWFGPHAAPEATHASAEEPSAVPAFLEEAATSHPVPYDENLLEKSRTQWQFGDWDSLAKLDRDTLQHHPDRAKLALLATAGRLQTDNAAEARQFIRLAQDWGVGKKLVSQILIAGVHNSIGRAAAIGNHQHRALEHFEDAISIGTPGCDTRLFTDARRSRQLNQLGIQTLFDPDSLKKTRLTISVPDVGNEWKLSNDNTRKIRQNIYKTLSLFEYIYKKKRWGSEEGWLYFSGSGSHDANLVEPYVRAITEFFKNISHSMSVVDIGCGDFNVGRQICGLFRKYTAVDVVEGLINHNKQAYKALNVNFLHLDAMRDTNRVKSSHWSLMAMARRFSAKSKGSDPLRICHHDVVTITVATVRICL
jgi:hypothetical protein